MLRLVIGLLLTSFLPGFALSYIIFRLRELSIIERIVYSFGLSLFVTIILNFLTPRIHLFTILLYYLVFFIISGGLIFFKYFLKKQIVHKDVDIKKYIEVGKKEHSIPSLKAALLKQGISENQIDEVIENPSKKKKIIRAVIISIIILFTCFVVYSPHLDYPYPFHYDEWMHLKDSLKSIEAGKLVEKGFGTNTEAGYYMWLTATVLTTGMEPLEGFKFIPMLFMAMTSLTLYAFLKRITGSFSIAVFGMLFLASVKTNVNVLGPWFFVPLSMAFPLIYLFFFSLVRGVKFGNEKFFILAFFFLLTLLTIHFFSALFTVPIFIIYLIINYRFVLKRFYMVLPTFIIPLLAFVFTLKFFPAMGFGGAIKALSEGFGIIYPPVWGSLMPRYKILLFYGNLAYVLAIFGLFISIKKYRIFVIWALVTGIWFYLNMLVFLHNILIPYIRIIYSFIFGMIPLSAIGLNWCIDIIEKKIKFGKPLTTIISAALLLTVFTTTFYNYYNVPYHLDLYRYIEPEDVEALKYAKDDVLSTVPLVKVAYDFFDLDFDVKTTIELDINYHLMNCSEKERFMLEKRLFYVLTNKQEHCDFLKPVYNGKIRYLYQAIPE